jgi:Rho-binding antiterminator
MSDDDDRYDPIDCALHDRLEAAATLGRPVRLRYETPEGELEMGEERIMDILTRNGAEYLTLASGVEVRLDRIVEADGIPFAPPGPR